MRHLLMHLRHHRGLLRLRLRRQRRQPLLLLATRLPPGIRPSVSELLQRARTSCSPAIRVLIVTQLDGGKRRLSPDHRIRCKLFDEASVHRPACAGPVRAHSWQCGGRS